MDLYRDLRTKYPEFYYHGYEITDVGDSYNISYSFEIKGLSMFNPTWTFNKGNSLRGIDSVFENLVFNLGMVELISYWKLTCSPTVIINCGSLDEKQIAWWKKLYFNGLGECFYLNGIVDSEEGFMSITSNGTSTFDKMPDDSLKGCLIPVGGGKDSAVTIKILEPLKNSNYCYIINPRGATLDTVKASGYESKTIITKRTLDKRMIELNKQGFINGHTPYSAIVAFSSVLAAYINGLKYVALSNESSANETTVQGSYVNHQYSKSFEFEKDFHDYQKAYIDSGVYYFSLLRPLSEYQIASIFAQYPEFHNIFRSCNAGSKEDIWCGKCPKCLFVYIIMSPFLNPENLQMIFGKNLFDDLKLLEDFKKLIGEVSEKPFECVGGREEVNFSLCTAVDKYDKLPKLLEYYVKTKSYDKYKCAINPFVDYFDSINLLPEEFVKLLNRQLNAEE